MTTPFSDFLAAHAGRVAELLPGAGAPPDLTHGRAAALVDAVLQAAAGGGVTELCSLYGLSGRRARPGGLERAMRDLGALRSASLRVAATAVPDAEQRIQLVASMAAVLGDAGSELALECVRAQGAARDSGRTTSLSVTMHELRRPLTILNSYAQLLGAGMLGELPESAAVAVEGITASTEMMVRMVNSLAELSRLEDPDEEMRLEQVTAEEVVAGAIEPCALEAKLRGTRIQASVQPGVRLCADRRRLVLALTNLVGNAVKHGPADSTVEVEVRSDAGRAHFVVRDHGAGFPPEDADHLFDKYFRSVAERHRKVPGSGLGLYIVRTVAEKHGGKVAARCRPGAGAEFEMIIPVGPEA